MTIQEAIKSGKPFRRPEWAIHMEGLWLNMVLLDVAIGADNLREANRTYAVSTLPLQPPYNDEDGYVFSADDLLANDWETRP